MSRRIGASLLAVLLLTGCASVPGGSANPPEGASPSPPATPSPFTLLPSAWPPASLEPASPAHAWPTTAGLLPDPIGRPLLQHIQWTESSCPRESLTVLEDGRIVVTRWEEFGGRFVVRRLSPSGVAFVRAAVDSVGLFDQSRARQPANEPDCISDGDALWFTGGDATVKVSRELVPSDSSAPSAAWDRFDALVAAMADPETWIPASGWVAGDWQPYRATSFCLKVSLEPADNPRLDGSRIDWSGILPVATFGKPAWEGAPVRAGVIDGARAHALALDIGRAANAAGIPTSGRYPIPFDQGGMWLGIGGIRVAGEATPLALTIDASPPFFTTCP